MLAPQHFQQWDAYLEAQSVERQLLNVPYPWGVHVMELDTESLARGDLRVVSFRGVLPSGVLIRVPEFDPPPPIASIGDSLDHRTDAVDVHLGLPLKRSGWPNYAREGDSETSAEDTRYSVRSVVVPDESTGRDERSIERAEQNLRVLLPSDTRENYESMPIARVTRTASGDFVLVDDYVPPALSLQASPLLQGLARDVLEKLVTRSSSLASQFSESGLDSRDITPGNLRHFLHFAAINGAIPQLANLKDRTNTHPSELYQMLAGVAGHLTTFQTDRFHPRDVPPYRHENLGETFNQLRKMILELLDVGPGHAGYDMIPMISTGREGEWRGTLDKEEFRVSTAGLYLMLTTDRLGEQAVLGASNRIIVSAPDRLPQLLASAVPGVPLRHVTQPPPAIPRRGEAVYFQLDTRDPKWEEIGAAQSLTVYLPGEIRNDVQLELLVIGGRT
jgi:type VI secretion system protein ImpJ